MGIFEDHPRLVWIMSAACGLGVANLYYNQPLLIEIQRTYSASSQQVGLVNTFTQIGYAVGMLLFIPLADLLNRRGLTVRLFLAVAVALVAAAFSSNLTWLILASLLVGITTVSPQVVIPFASSLANPQQRGRVIGSLYTGLLLGILLARTVSGIIGDYAGWRTMFYLAAGTMALMAFILRVLLPEDHHQPEHRYGELMRSLWELAKTHRELRSAALIGGSIFGAFSAFWTTLVFFLATPPYRYGAKAAGAFGVVGAAGAFVAPFAGRLADRFGTREVRSFTLLGILIAYLGLWLAGHHLVGLVMGVLLLDASLQASHICNQTRILNLLHKAQGRANTIYMISYFVGGSLGSFLGIWSWTRWQWNGVCAVGTSLATVALVLHFVMRPASAAVVVAEEPASGLA